jgi:hypothetical protein
MKVVWFVVMLLVVWGAGVPLEAQIPSDVTNIVLGKPSSPQPRVEPATSSPVASDAPRRELWTNEVPSQKREARPAKPKKVVVRAKPAVVAQVAPAPVQQGGTVRHKVLRGETLLGICRGDKECVKVVAAQNGIKNPNLISVGASLVVPASFGQTSSTIVGDNSAQMAALALELGNLKAMFNSLASRIGSGDPGQSQALTAALTQAASTQKTVEALQKEVPALRQEVGSLRLALATQSVNTDQTAEIGHLDTIQADQGAKIEALAVAHNSVWTQVDDRLLAAEGEVVTLRAALDDAHTREADLRARVEALEAASSPQAAAFEGIKSRVVVFWKDPGRWFERQLATPHRVVGLILCAGLIILLIVLLVIAARKVTRRRRSGKENPNPAYADSADAWWKRPRQRWSAEASSNGRHSEHADQDVVDADPVDSRHNHVIDPDLLEDVSVDISARTVSYPVVGSKLRRGRRYYRLQMQPGCNGDFWDYRVAAHLRDCYQCRHKLAIATGLPFKGVELAHV